MISNTNVNMKICKYIKCSVNEITSMEVCHMCECDKNKFTELAMNKVQQLTFID